jgi:hypothetical protein
MQTLKDMPLQEQVSIDSLTQVTSTEPLKATGVIRVFLTRNIGRRAFELEEQDTIDTSDLDEAARSNAKRELEETVDKAYGTFQRLRGTPAFTQAVRDLSTTVGTSDIFELDTEAERLQKIGYEMGVLSQYLLEYELMPIYQMKQGVKLATEIRFHPKAEKIIKDLGDLGDMVRGKLNMALQKEWNKWDRRKIMLSRYGMYQITLEKDFTDETLPEVLEHVLGLEQELDLSSELEDTLKEIQQDAARGQLSSIRRRADLAERIEEARSILRNSLDYSVQWEAVRELITHFVKTFEGKLLVDKHELQFSENLRKAITTDTGTSYNLRFRYVVFEVHSVKSGGKSLPANEETQRKLDEELACLLEGVLLTDRESSTAGPAPIRPQKIKDALSDNVSTWTNEYCMFSSDNAVIRQHPQDSSKGDDEIFIKVSHPGTVKYNDYWASIMRGVAYLSELRVVAKLLESDTSDNLEEITSYMPHISAGPLETIEGVRRIIAQIATKVSSSSRLVARLRNASMPTTMGIADYAVTKYRCLSRVLEMEKIIEHAHSNISLINSALDHYDDVLLQSNSMNLQRDTVQLQKSTVKLQKDTVQLEKDTVHLQLDVKRDNKITIALTIMLTAITVVLAWLALPVFLNELAHPDSEAAAQINSWTSLPDTYLWIKWIVTVLTIALVPVAIGVVIGGIAGIVNINRLSTEALKQLEEREQQEKLEQQEQQEQLEQREDNLGLESHEHPEHKE